MPFGLTELRLLVQMRGPSWSVLQGRRDGLTSQATGVAGHLPGAHMDLPALQAVFGNIGLGVQDIVALSGTFPARTLTFPGPNFFLPHGDGLALWILATESVRQSIPVQSSRLESVIIPERPPWRHRLPSSWRSLACLQLADRTWLLFLTD